MSRVIHYWYEGVAYACIACGSRARDAEGTSNRDEVTCSRCRRTLRFRMVSPPRHRGWWDGIGRPEEDEDQAYERERDREFDAQDQDQD